MDTHIVNHVHVTPTIINLDINSMYVEIKQGANKSDVRGSNNPWPWPSHRLAEDRPPFWFCADESRAKNPRPDAGANSRRRRPASR